MSESTLIKVIKISAIIGAVIGILMGILSATATHQVLDVVVK